MLTLCCGMKRLEIVCMGTHEQDACRSWTAHIPKLALLVAGGMPALPSGSGSVGGGIAGLVGRMRSYAEAVRDLNDAVNAGQPFQAVSRFAAAAAADPDGAFCLLIVVQLQGVLRHMQAEAEAVRVHHCCGSHSWVEQTRRAATQTLACHGAADGERRSTMRMLWGVLARILAGAGEGAKSGAARTAGLLAGARRYLEDGHVTYMQNVIAANRAQARFHKYPPAWPPCMSTIILLSTHMLAASSSPLGGPVQHVWWFKGQGMCRDTGEACCPNGCGDAVCAITLTSQ